MDKQKLKKGDIFKYGKKEYEVIGIFKKDKKEFVWCRNTDSTGFVSYSHAFTYNENGELFKRS